MLHKQVIGRVEETIAKMLGGMDQSDKDIQPCFDSCCILGNSFISFQAIYLTVESQLIFEPISFNQMLK